MIGRPEIVQRSLEWGLREDVVEKDYVLGWVLWGIGSDAVLGNAWVFKGGTCLKKCYVETYRFSEDLDFTVLSGAPASEQEVATALGPMLARVQEASGIDFGVRDPRLRVRPDGASMEGRLYYRGPRRNPEAASIKLDLSMSEAVVRPPVLRPISHAYPDALPAPATVRCYSFEEVFAEKLRAMGERGRPRDLYDTVNLYRRRDLRLHPHEIRLALVDKCETKGVVVPTFDAVERAATRAELETEWGNMLGHQLPALPPFDQFWGELAGLFAWLAGEAVLEEALPIAAGSDDDPGWTPPATAWVWGSGSALETIRFAAVNRLCVELGYTGTHRVIEPYSLRRSRAGALLLHALRAGTSEHRSYRADLIQSARVTTRPFRPVYAIEFGATGPIPAPATVRRGTGLRRSRRPASGSGPVYVIECPSCERQFRRTTRSTTLRAHKDAYGDRCYGRRGLLVDTL